MYVLALAFAVLGSASLKPMVYYLRQRGGRKINSWATRFGIALLASLVRFITKLTSRLSRNQASDSKEN